MKTFRNGALITVLALLGACDSYSGKLSATSTFNVKDGGGRTVQVPRGSHDMKVSVNNKVNVEIAFATGGQTKISLPKIQTNPSNGQFTLTAAQTGQAFDIQGRIQGQSWNGNVEARVESCEYDRYYVPHCETRCSRDRYGRGHCWNECRDVVHIVYGRRNVEGYTKNSNNQLTMKLVATSGGSLGTFNGGSAVKTQFVQTRVGPCRR